MSVMHTITVRDVQLPLRCIYSHWALGAYQACTIVQLLAAWRQTEIGKPVPILLLSYRDIQWWSSTCRQGPPPQRGTTQDGTILAIHCSLYTLVIRQHHLQVISRTYGYWLPSHTNKQRPLVCLRAEVFPRITLGYCDISVIDNELIDINITDSDKNCRDRCYASC